MYKRDRYNTDRYTRYRHKRDRYKIDRCKYRSTDTDTELNIRPVTRYLAKYLPDTGYPT